MNFTHNKLLQITFRATAVLLFVALLAQAPHAMEVFLRIAPDATGWEFYLAFAGAWLYAIALESATAYFVWKRQNQLATLFAVISIAHNFAYYMPPGPLDTWLEEMTFRYMFSALLVSMSLPIAIAAFSHVQAQVDASKHASAVDNATGATASNGASKQECATVNATASAIDNVLIDNVSTQAGASEVDSASASGAASDSAIAQTEDVALDVTTFSDAQAKTLATKVRKPASDKQDVKLLPVNLQEAVNLSDSEIGKLTGVTRQAVGIWRKNGVLIDKLSERLPELATVSANGHNGNGYNGAH